MSTEKQTNSNRDNAKKSTGPKTPEGKAIASQNAVKHGFFAKNDVISGEDLAAYESHRQDIYDEFAPLTPSESVLTQRIATLTWRLMRADRLQTTVINTLVDHHHKATPKPVRETFNIEAMVKELRRKDENPEYALNDAGIILAGLVRRKHEPVTTDPAVDEAIHAANSSAVGNHICDVEILLGTVIYNDFHGSAVIERLQGYEQRIESSLFKTIRQIQQIQERRTKAAAAQEKRDGAYLRAEDEAKRNRREAEFWEKMKNEPNPDPRAEHEPNPRTGTARRAPDAQNEANSELTSISDTTYNRSRREKAKRNQSEDPNQRDNPDRSDNK